MYCLSVIQTVFVHKYYISSDKLYDLLKHINQIWIFIVHQQTLNVVSNITLLTCIKYQNHFATEKVLLSFTWFHIYNIYSKIARFCLFFFCLHFDCYNKIKHLLFNKTFIKKKFVDFETYTIIIIAIGWKNFYYEFSVSYISDGHFQHCSPFDNVCVQFKQSLIVCLPNRILVIKSFIYIRTYI